MAWGQTQFRLIWLLLRPHYAGCLPTCGGTDLQALVLKDCPALRDHALKKQDDTQHQLSIPVQLDLSLLPVSPRTSDLACCAETRKTTECSKHTSLQISMGPNGMLQGYASKYNILWDSRSICGAKGQNPNIHRTPKHGTESPLKRNLILQVLCLSLFEWHHRKCPQWRFCAPQKEDEKRLT